MAELVERTGPRLDTNSITIYIYPPSPSPSSPLDLLEPVTPASTATDPAAWCSDPTFIPVWARSHVKYAQNLLECSDEPVEYDDDEDYIDNCFFFPEDCVYNPPDLASNPDADAADADSDSDTDSSLDEMSPALPEIKMLDT
ncbi:hypothetical protein FQN49_008895, partial [Arthroderma sp. PD_2]